MWEHEQWSNRLLLLLLKQIEWFTETCASLELFKGKNQVPSLLLVQLAYSNA